MTDLPNPDKSQLMTLGVTMTRHYGSVSLTLEMSYSAVIQSKEDVEARYDKIAYTLQQEHDRLQGSIAKDETVKVTQQHAHKSTSEPVIRTYPVTAVKPHDFDGKPGGKVYAGHWQKWGVSMYPEMWVTSEFAMELGGKDKREVTDVFADIEMIGEQPKRVHRLYRQSGPNE